MKILIFAHTRSGSSLLQQIVASAFNLEDRQEPFTYYMNDTAMYSTVIDSLEQTDNYVIKLQAHNMTLLDVCMLNFKLFDKIYITERKDKALACISNHWALQTNKWSYRDNESINELTPFHVGRAEVMNFSYTLKVFNDTITYLRDRQITYEHIILEDIESNDVNISVQLICKKIGLDYASIAVNHRKSFLDYANYCVNYDQVKKWMAEDGF